MVLLSAEETKALSGKILWNGNGLALKVGELKSKESKQSYTFFTNRKGRFLIEAIKPGSYEAWIEGKPLGEIIIRKDGPGIQHWEYKK